ncbi:MFS transporter [Cryptosporangium japonicum]|uniref:Major facilitator superfamily (MFS) profile domain-containing protein n=1 Tax=Cryptosporangium japonicum TaxID=80872 RepID=A0ABN0UF51_9ACTN
MLFVALVVVTLLTAMDATIVATALPTIVADLGGERDLAWIFVAYTLAVTIAMPMFGRLGDLRGRRTLFLSSIAAFVLTSLLCGFVTGFGQLIALRFGQGIGGGGITVLSLAVVADAVPARERGRFLAPITAVYGIASVVSPLLGGTLTDTVGWRWIFWVNAPLGALALLLAWVSVPAVAVRARARFDWTGTALLTTWTTGAVLFAAWGGSRIAWSSPRLWAIALGALAGFAAFVAWSRGREHPIVPLWMFRHRVVVISSGLAFVVGAAVFGMVGYLPGLMQAVYGLPATVAGSVVLPMVAGIMLTSIWTGHRVARTGRYRSFPVYGSLAGAVALVGLATIGTGTPVALIGLFIGVLGLGVGCFNQVMTVAVQDAMPAAVVGTATAAVTLVRELGVTLGSAALGGLLGARLLAGLGDRAALAGLSPARLRELPDAARELYAQTYLTAMRPLFLGLVLLFLLALAASAFLPDHRLSAAPPSVPIGDDMTYPDDVDVAIVGSGPTGAAYARILTERAPSARIAVFEAGPVLTDPPGMHVKNIADDAERIAAQRRSEGLRPHTDSTAGEYADPARRVVRPGTFLLESGYQVDGEDGLPALAMSTNVGGMGAHWTGACPRPGDAERIDFLPDLDELLDEAERLLSVDKHPFAGAPYTDVVRDRLAAEFDPGRAADRRVQPMPLAVHRRDDGALIWSGPDVVFGDVTRDNPNFSLYAESPVKRVLIEDGKAVGVHVNGVDVRARYVVVACDALRTPQLLFASGVRLPALGRYLNDQPQTVFAIRLRDVREPAADTGDATEIVGQSGVGWVPYTDEHPFHGQVMQLDASPIPLVSDDEPALGTIVGLGWFCGKDLQASDRIEFDEDTTDDYGMPKPTIHYRLTPRDHETLARARTAILRAATALGEHIGTDPFVLSPGASLHYQGTTRMGPVDDGTSVCGPNSEVWGVDGLYVAGNNVIPTPIACNPTLTSVALAVTGARNIAAHLTTPTAAATTGR